MTPAVIETEGLTKYYGRSRGLIDLRLQVKRGEIFGFLGPNDAGKTTAIRLLLDLIRPTRGRARLLGLDPQRDGVEARRRGGYLPGELALYPDRTGQQVLEYAAHLRNGVPPKEIARLARHHSRACRHPAGRVSALPAHRTGGLPAARYDPLSRPSFYVAP